LARSASVANDPKQTSMRSPEIRGVQGGRCISATAALPAGYVEHLLREFVTAR
jgi:hypothetical protein